jgi:hypothetical protein
MIKIPPIAVREEKLRGVEFPGQYMVKAVIEIHQAKVHQNHTLGCFPCPHGSTKNPQTRKRCDGSGVPPADRLRQRTPDPTPPLAGTPPAPTGNASGPQCSQMDNLPAGYTYSHTALPSAEC